jgi:hypothetical protein
MTGNALSFSKGMSLYFSRIDLLWLFNSIIKLSDVFTVILSIWLPFISLLLRFNTSECWSPVKHWKRKTSRTRSRYFLFQEFDILLILWVLPMLRRLLSFEVSTAGAAMGSVWPLSLNHRKPFTSVGNDPGAGYEGIMGIWIGNYLFFSSAERWKNSFNQ